MAAYQQKGSGQRGKLRGNAVKSNRPRRRKNPPGNPLLRRFQKLARRVVKRISSLDKHLFLVAAGLVLVIIFITAAVWLLTNKNAFEVYLAETKIGILKKSDEITAESLEKEAVAKLADQLGANVAVNEAIKLTPVHAGRNDIDSQSYVVSELCKKYTYKVEAAVITVDGVEMAIVKNISEAEKIQENIIAQYIPEGSQIIDSGFDENVQVQLRFVEKSDIITNDMAYTILTARKEAVQTYTVVNGDSLWAITNRVGITQEKLLELNPEMDPQKPLKIGQEMVLTVPTNFLSVKTVEKATYTEIAYAETQYLNNPNERKNYSRVVQIGKDGQKEVTYHITRLNGSEVEREVIGESYLVNPVPEIIEVGTK